MCTPHGRPASVPPALLLRAPSAARRAAACTQYGRNPLPGAQLMAPNTATALRESKRNQIKDFLHVAGPLGVTHFLILTATHNASYLRIAK